MESGSRPVKGGFRFRQRAGLTRHEGVSIRFLLYMFHGKEDTLVNKLVAADIGGCGPAFDLMDKADRQPHGYDFFL